MVYAYKHEKEVAHVLELSYLNNNQLINRNINAFYEC